MNAPEQTEYIVQGLRMQGAMYEEDARAFLAEHDAGVRERALAEAAAFVGNDDTCGCGGCSTCYGRHLAAGLLAMAGEKATAPAETLTVYRAEWYGDPLCTYSNLRAAQKHCEAAARINLFNRDDVPVSWIPDDEDDPAIWDLVERRGDVKEPTGYCVAGADVASEYNEGAVE